MSTHKRYWIDPIGYAWKLCNPTIPLPEKLRFDPRVAPT